MNIPSHRSLLVFLLALLLSCAACGGASPGGPGLPPVAVHEVIPSVVQPDVDTSLQILGMGFLLGGSVGDAVEITFTETDAAQPLEAVVMGTLASDSVVEGSILNTLATRPILREMQMSVTLRNPATGAEVSSAGPLVTFRPHLRIVDIPWREVRSTLVRKRIRIEGMGFQDLQQPVARFRATSGQPFQLPDGSYTAELNLGATVKSDTVIEIETPSLRMSGTTTTTFALGDFGANFITNGQTMTFDPDGYAVASHETEDLFGAAVDISGDTAVVGAPLKDHFLSTGAAYVVEGRGSAARIVQRLEPVGGPTADFEPLGAGISVAIEGDRIAVGAPYSGAPLAPPYNATLDFSGAVYVFERPGPGQPFVQVAVLTRQVAGERLGSAVALSGGLVAAGAPYATAPAPVAPLARAGAVAIFKGQGPVWSSTAVVASPTPIEDAVFGHAVDLNGETLAVGAPGMSGTNLSGAVFIYDWTQGGGWSFSAARGPLVPGQGRVRFGSSVALDDGRLLVGAPGDSNTNVPVHGEVTLLERDPQTGSWDRVETIRAVYSWPGDLFGRSVALRGDRALVSSREIPEGAASFYEITTDLYAPRRGFTLIERVRTPSPGPGEIGGPVALDAYGAIVGAVADTAVSGGVGRIVRY